MDKAHKKCTCSSPPFATRTAFVLHFKVMKPENDLHPGLLSNSDRANIVFDIKKIVHGNLGIRYVKSRNIVSVRTKKIWFGHDPSFNYRPEGSPLPNIKSTYKQECDTFSLCKM